MGRLLLLLSVALGLALFYAPSRGFIVETLDPLAHPVRRWMTEQELARVVKDLEAVQGSQREFPIGRRGDFEVWVAQRYPQQSSRQDEWGTPYRADFVDVDRFRVTSAGPDRVFGTEDDLWREGTRRASASRSR